MPSKKPKVMIYLDEEKHDFLKKWAEQEHRSVNNLIVMLLEQAIARKGTIDESDLSTKRVTTIATLVRDNYGKLSSINSIKPERLQALINGEKPNASDLTKLAHNLDLEEEYIVELRDRSFPPTQKKREPNGTT